MKNQTTITVKTAALIASLACAVNLRATSIQGTAVLNNPASGDNAVQIVEFRGSSEAGLLRDAYRILATGDHDYKGHRAKAMHSVEAAGKLLGVDVAGDLKDRTPQALSDARLQEAQGLITRVLESAEVRGQKRVVKHLNEAVKQINVALQIR
jgi:hypothetical protein